MISLEEAMKIWNDDEVASLFADVEECKQNRKALKHAFEKHANAFGRKLNSVRNYYYQEVENLKDDKNRCKNLKIDLKKHTKNHFLPFNEKDKQVLAKVDDLVKSGSSVREACKSLSGGDVLLMTRLQNKYQNTKRSRRDNVIMFRKNKKNLTESEINSLLMGLVKLIKKTAVEDYIESKRAEKENATELLRQAFFEIGKKERQFQELKKNFELIKNENKMLNEKLSGLVFDKNTKLKEHLSKKSLKRAVET